MPQGQGLSDPASTAAGRESLGASRVKALNTSHFTGVDDFSNTDSIVDSRCLSICWIEDHLFASAHAQSRDYFTSPSSTYAHKASCCPLSLAYILRVALRSTGAGAAAGSL